ncbi:MAG: endonuclease III [Candidatus Lokiarchaeota archaeon]|nr:endonuclease III [Candidatus Lokiarchaeota archaeon]
MPDFPRRKQKARDTCRILIENYGDIIHERRLPPIDELILTILSQNTTDVNSRRAFESLKERFDSWELLLKAPQEEVAEAINCSGLYNIKAERIKAALAKIQSRVGELDLSLLNDMPLDEAKNWLTSLHGVGPKTAAIILLFSFGRPALPVDTHVWRVTKRLGLIDQDTSREKAHVVLEEIIPHDCVFSLNRNLVKHGRGICKAQNPLCEKCFLNEHCDYYASL